MNIPKELMEQWASETARMSIHQGIDHIAQRAAEWALSQPVSMEPVAFVCAPSDSSPISMTCPVKSLDILTTMHNAPLYTQSQLAAARKQGAEDGGFWGRTAARQSQRIAELESLLQQTLEAVGLFQRGEPCEEAFDNLTTAIAEVKP